MSSVYCRFCAEEKTYSEMITVSSQKDLGEKLLLLGLTFVDFSNKTLPETVCVTCNELTTISYEFILKIKKSQEVLSKLCGLEVETDGCTFPNYEEVKEESDDGEYLQDDNLSSFTTQSLVKEEKYNNEDVEVPIDGSIKSGIASNLNTLMMHKLKRRLTWATYPWICSICGFHDYSLTSLREHCRTLHVKCFAVKCADCDESLDEFEEFVAHVRRHKKVLRHYCEYCNIKMEGRSHSDSHITDNLCTICGESFTNQTSLHTHLKLYVAKPTGLLAFNMHISEVNDLSIGTWDEYPAICQNCSLKVKNREVLIEHCVEAHKTCFGSQCVDCGESVGCFKDFLEHVVRHRPNLSNICPQCNMSQTDPAHTDHTEGYPCPLCGKVFKQKEHLKLHQSLTQTFIKSPIKRRKGPQSCTCQICGMIMKTPASLKGHLQTHTNRKRNYTCDRCGKAYYTKGSLDVHRKIHDKTTKEACKICQKTFLTVPRLKKHIKTHNLEMPYQCDECKRFFNSKDRLREHVKVHLDILPFQCHYCTKKFRHKSIMKTHENQHTGARPYSCNLCCMEFANWSNCNKHMKRKHGTTLAKNVMTPHGKLALNPKTGKPDQLFMDKNVKEWSEMMLMGREKGKKTDV